MRILWLTWRDKKHPRAGGAEVLNEGLARLLAKDGHEVHFIVGGFLGCAPEEDRDGFHITRLGGRFSVYWKAYRYYKRHYSRKSLKKDSGRGAEKAASETYKAYGEVDAEAPQRRSGPFSAGFLVIDEMNTIPFFAKFYVKEKNIMMVHQLCRQIWWYEMPFPFSLIGYLVEPLYLYLLNDREVVTVSESTKRDLMRFGFKAEKIHIVSEGTELSPVADVAAVQKYDRPTILAFGAIRAMKRTHHIVSAFEILRRTIPDAKLIIAGAPHGRYGARVLARAKKSTYVRDIEYVSAPDAAKKAELFERSHVLAVTSAKEGWGLVVTEANSQGTPAVVYDVDGLRDSVRSTPFEASGEVGGMTGIITKGNTPEALASALARLLADESAYATMQKRGWEWSKEITFDKSYREFINVIK